MTTLPGKDFNVAIVGGGMCGAAAAYGLARAGVPVQVFEAAAKFGEVGAGAPMLRAVRRHRTYGGDGNGCTAIVSVPASHFPSYVRYGRRANAKQINVVAFVADHDKPKGSELPLPWVTSVPHEELKASYEGWGPDAQIILDHLKNPSKWSIRACITPLQSYVRDRVVLVGDAAHGMLPHLGAGVGQGFEDVFTLTEFLKHPQTNKSNIDVSIQFSFEINSH
ncbi:salicylate hydroxylase [Moniliophthora roreri MCA 2997]|uniref:Salicylate hydroxylase n=1 Tax=Moniliophthora roreri (strain MCA 2997) TaxID=1381753 RepID=V2XEL4_MONRO|nr:salicylate hydroxylase [Moniliophthora roreri MCA 2997]